MAERNPRMVDGPPTPSSADIVIDQVKGRIALQSTQISALDGKANFGLATAGFLTTGAAALQTALKTAQQRPTPPSWSIPGLGAAVPLVPVAQVLTAAAIAMFLGVVCCTYLAYQIRHFDAFPNPPPFVRDFLDKPEHVTKAFVATEMAKSYAANTQMVLDKLKWTKRALRSLIAEACLLLALTLVQFAL